VLNTERGRSERIGARTFLTRGGEAGNRECAPSGLGVALLFLSHPMISLFSFLSNFPLFDFSR
jgi:hypothetical protein